MLNGNIDNWIKKEKSECGSIYIFWEKFLNRGIYSQHHRYFRVCMLFSSTSLRNTLHCLSMTTWQREVFPSLLWKNLTSLHRALNSALPFTFGIIWKTSYDFHLQTSELNFTDALVHKWKQVPAARVPKPVESLFRRVEAMIPAYGCSWFYLWV